VGCFGLLVLTVCRRGRVGCADFEGLLVWGKVVKIGILRRIGGGTSWIRS
jgi:hypothetical protein